MLRSTTNALLLMLLLPLAVKSTVTPTEPLAKAHDAKSKFHALWPNVLYLGVDVAKTGYGWYQKIGNSYELHASTHVKDILFYGDYGWGQITRDKRQQQGSYSDTIGSYFRLGIACNFLSWTKQHNQFFIGIDYAKSFFNFQLNSTKLACDHQASKECEPLCKAPQSLQSLGGDGVASWWEVVAGGKVYLMPMVSMGCMARYKFAKKMTDSEVLPFDIPGWGLGEDTYAFGYSVYLLLHIPLVKGKF